MQYKVTISVPSFPSSDETQLAECLAPFDGTMYDAFYWSNKQEELGIKFYSAKPNLHETLHQALLAKKISFYRVALRENEEK